MYKNIIRPLLFSFDSENIHDFSFNAIKVAQSLKVTNVIQSLNQSCFDPRLAISINGLNFPNPIGLAAGFDKQAVAFDFFQALGFGSIEVGTITSKAQPGNPKPRIFRLTKDQAIINRMGFPSIGVDAVLDRLQQIKNGTNKKSVLGINIGKAKDIPLENASADYLAIYQKIHRFTDYVTINVSSPNTPDLRKLQDPSRLKELFSAIKTFTSSEAPLVFVKLSPDIELADLEPIVNVCLETNLDGLIATNTTIQRPSDLMSSSNLVSEAGGLSGKPLFEKSLNFISTLSKISQRKLPIIAVGGISSASDVISMLKAGASSIQIYTALIYEGPLIAHQICKELIKTIESQGCSDIAQLVSS